MGCHSTYCCFTGNCGEVIVTLGRGDPQVQVSKEKEEKLEKQMTQEGAEMAKLSLDLAEITPRFEQAEGRGLKPSELAP